MKNVEITKQVPALNSPQRQIPERTTPRCGRSQCQGNSCPGWKFCAPTTAFGNIHLARISAPCAIS